MKLTKEDLMLFSKERLVDIILEMQEEKVRKELFEQPQNPLQPIQNPTSFPPCYAPGGFCTNPFHDCVDCPRQFGGGYTTSTSWTSDGNDIQPKK